LDKWSVDVMSFLKKHGMDYRLIDVERSTQEFVSEMERGLSGADSTLRMIPTYLSAVDEIPVNKTVIVLDAGGTNLRAAVVHFNEAKEPVIESFTNYPMPGTHGEVTSEQFFEGIADAVEPILDKSDTVSFCFSYATEPLADKDNRVLEIRKQLKVKDLLGEKIGERLQKVLTMRGHERKKIVVFNDSVATLLAGVAESRGKQHSSFVGFILGTGTNTCYLESAAKISKLPGGSKDDYMLINTESGGYGLFNMSEIDREFDLSTADPGKYVYEKMISGKYQGILALTAVKKASVEGLFSESFKSEISRLVSLDSSEVDRFLDSPSDDGVLGRCCTGENADADRSKLLCMLNAIVERTARLVTINLVATLLKTGEGRDAGSPVCIALDGSVCHYSTAFREKLDQNMREFALEKHGIYFDFYDIKNGTLLGAAIAGLQN
jgi:hexokinase